MAYRIDLDAPLAAELRRVAADQLGSAVAGLGYVAMVVSRLVGLTVMKHAEAD